MQIFKRILVPVDFSADSAEATRVAADLARRFEATLMLVHVYDPLVYSLPNGFVMVPQIQTDELFAALRKQLADSKRMALDAGAPTAETALLQGFVAGEIAEYAKVGEFDLIVMGTHGRTGVPHFLMGSVAERVVRLAPCPVLTVKKAKPAAAA